MKLKINGQENLSAIYKELSYAVNQRWLELINDLINHKLIEAHNIEPKVIVSLNSGGYELGDPIIFKVIIPERIKQLEEENKDLKNKIEVFKTVFQKGENVLNEELQKVYNLTKEIK